jgi:hypothetical protein
MPKKQRYIEISGLLLSLFLLMGLTTGCRDKSSSAVFATNRVGEPVVEATKNALSMIGYRVNENTETKDTNESPRGIHGERLGMVSGIGPARLRIRIVVTPLEKGSQIEVDVIPPTGAYGSTVLPLHDYQYALSQVIPDLTVKSKRVPYEFF